MLMRSQAKQEREKDFHNHIFEAKLEAFKKLLQLIFEMDDDHVITEMEIKGVENQAGIVCLIAGENLVSLLAQFMNQLKIYGRIYYRNMDDEQISTFITSNNDFLAQPSVAHSYICPKKKHRHGVGRLIGEESAESIFVSLDEVVQGMRDDLAVVEGNIEQMLAAFVLVPFDAHLIMRSPNVAH